MKKHGFILLFFAFISSAQAGIFSPATSFRCVIGKTAKIVAVTYLEEGKKVPCQVHYGLEGDANPKVIFTAKAKGGYCEEKASEFVKKLEGLKYECKSL
jgi:hypothetical protein